MLKEDVNGNWKTKELEDKGHGKDEDKGHGKDIELRTCLYDPNRPPIIPSDSIARAGLLGEGFWYITGQRPNILRRGPPAASSR